MDSLNQLIVFTLDDQRYALHLPSVERIVRVVEITPLPKAPGMVLGVVNIQGRIIPVVNIRRRFGLPERETNLSDQLIIAKTSKRPVAILTDGVSRVIEESAERVVTSEEILSGMKYVEGVVKFEDGMILIHDLDKFLSIEEEKILDDAMKTEIMVQESEVRDE
jgi:purine-binding chemotaxis protein CheW